MAIDVGVTIDGLPELILKLDSLKVETRQKGGRFAMRKAAQVIRDQARKNAEAINDPATSENIAKNIVERFSPRRYKRTGDLMFRVGVLGGARGFAAASGELQGAGSGNPGGDTFYWRFLEFGTSKHAATPFMRPAADQSAQKATDVFIREYNKAIDRALRRAAKTGTSV